MKKAALHARRQAGFLLIEVMLAVAIFAVAVIALGRSVENVVEAQVIKEEHEQVRRFLEGKISEIEAGAVPISDTVTTEDIKDWLPGAKLKTKRTQIKRKNEKDQDLFGLYVVDVDLTWKSQGSDQSRSVAFYIYPEQR
jgi:type II secretory pathway pseudopilin PulG